MASMNNCEDIANKLASKLSTSVKTKASGTNKNMAYCNGTLTNNLTYQVMDIDAQTIEGNNVSANYDVTISNDRYRSQVNMPRTGNNNTTAASRAANAWNGAQTTN